MKQEQDCVLDILIPHVENWISLKSKSRKEYRDKLLQIHQQKEKKGKFLCKLNLKRVEKDIHILNIAKEFLTSKENDVHYLSQTTEIPYKIEDNLNVLFNLIDIKDKAKIEKILITEKTKKLQKRMLKKIIRQYNLLKRNKKSLLITKQMITILDNYAIEYYNSIKNYSKNIKFKSSFYDLEKSEELQIIEELYKLNKLEDKFIENNYEKIQKSYMNIKKLEYINKRIDEILVCKDKSDRINWSAFENLLKNIKIKNEKTINKEKHFLKKINIKEIKQKYEKVQIEKKLIRLNERKEILKKYRSRAITKLKSENKIDEETYYALINEKDRSKMEQDVIYKIASAEKLIESEVSTFEILESLNDQDQKKI